MALAASTTVENNSEISYDVKNARNVLFGKLDEAIDDIEKRRTLSSEEMILSILLYTFFSRMFDLCCIR